jgi:hypothetical protein
MNGQKMLLPMTPERFAAIRKRVMERRTKALVAEIAATDWDKLPRFNSVDDFLRYADTFIEQSNNPPGRSRKRN